MKMVIFWIHGWEFVKPQRDFNSKRAFILQKKGISLKGYTSAKAK